MEHENSYLNYQISGKNIPSICHERIKGIYKNVKYFVDYVNLHNNGFTAICRMRFSKVSVSTTCTFNLEVKYILDNYEDAMDNKVEDFMTRVCNLVNKEYKNATVNLKEESTPIPTIKMCKEFVCGKIGS